MSAMIMTTPVGRMGGMGIQGMGLDDSPRAMAAPRAPIRLLLVDDQVHVRRGLRMRLALEDDVLVVGDAGDAETAILLAEQCHPDVVIMDIELPGMDGITATEQLHRACPGVLIVMLSLHDDPDTQTRALSAGATAFVAKHRMEGPLLAAVRQSIPARLEM